MARIPSWHGGARLGLWAAALSMALAGCLEDRDRPDLPTLVVDPPSAFQGALVSLNLTAAGVSFDACDALTLESLVFDGSSTSDGITVHGVDLVSPGSVRAVVSVAADAPTGEHLPALRCDASTTLTGSFTVEARSAEPHLSVSPSSGAAGVFGEQIVLGTDEPFFAADETYVVFGDGTDIVVTEQVVVDTQKMAIRIDIVAEAQQKELQVVAVTGDRVARGAFTVTERINPAIRVDPEVVERPAAEEEKARQYTLDVRGTGVGFRAPAPDAGADDDTASTVAFPGNPGITVTAVEVEDSGRLFANIAVDGSANVGWTPLVVTTQADAVSTVLNVVAGEGESVIEILPEGVPRGCRNRPIQLVAKNFDLAPASELTLTCLETDCTVTFVPSTVLPKSLIAGVTIGALFEGDHVTLEVKADSHTAYGILSVTEPTGLWITPSPEKLEQGAKEKFVRLMGKGGVFADDAKAEVLPRSGLAIVEQYQSTGKDALYLSMNAAQDAPCGPAVIRVVNGGQILEAPIAVVPSGDVPYALLDPSWVPQGRGTASMSLGVFGFDLSAAETTVTADDPAFHVMVVLVDGADPGRALVVAEVSPLARTDMSVLYIRGAAGKAAATFRVLDPLKAYRAAASPSSLVRGGSYSVSAFSSDVPFEAPAAQVVDDIGLLVTRAEVDPDDMHTVHLDVEVEEDGPGGWTGVLIYTASASVVVPVFLDAGGDESLTLDVSPASVRAGSRPTDVALTLPPQAVLVEDTLAVSCSGDGAYASNWNVEDADRVALSLDTLFGFEPQDPGVPLLVTLAKGAAIGHVQVDPLLRIEIDQKAPWEGVLAASVSALAEVAPGTLPALLSSAAGATDRASAHLALLSDNGLDDAEAVDDGSLWLVDEGDVSVVVSPAANPQGKPLLVEVKPIGQRARQEDEAPADDTDPPPEWSIVNDPCAEPFLGSGTLATGFDVDRAALPPTACRLVVAVLGRTLADRPWSTPDMWLEMRTIEGEPMAGLRSTGWPGALDPDPLLYIPADADGRVAALGAEQGTAGTYLVNIRRPNMVRELGRLAAAPFIELEIEAGRSLAAFEVEVWDPTTGALVGDISFSGTGIVSDGVVLVAGTAMEGAELVDSAAVLPARTAFAVRLLEDGDVVDAVQVGEGKQAFGEGKAIVATGKQTVFFRIVGIDTNDNRSDFAAGWRPTPGS